VENKGLVELEIKEIVNRETQAWSDKDVENLLSVFHQDMVWPWPRTSESHDPMDWILEWDGLTIKDGKRVIVSCLDLTN
jgi:hypothetical protein